MKLSPEALRAHKALTYTLWKEWEEHCDLWNRDDGRGGRKSYAIDNWHDVVEAAGLIDRWTYGPQIAGHAEDIGTVLSNGEEYLYSDFPSNGEKYYDADVLL